MLKWCVRAKCVVIMRRINGEPWNVIGVFVPYRRKRWQPERRWIFGTCVLFLTLGFSQWHHYEPLSCQSIISVRLTWSSCLFPVTSENGKQLCRVGPANMVTILAVLPER